MAEPSKERIAAALALAEAVCALATAVDGDGAVPPELLQARQDALRAYRATAPKLRTRAEVDAEIANLTRACVENEWAGGEDDYKRWELVTALCREETAPEPNAVTDHDADMREERPCGCEVLSKAIDQAIRDMLSGGHPFEAGVAKAINDLRAAQKEHP